MPTIIPSFRKNVTKLDHNRSRKKTCREKFCLSLHGHDVCNQLCPKKGSELRNRLKAYFYEQSYTRNWKKSMFNSPPIRGVMDIAMGDYLRKRM